MSVSFTTPQLMWPRIMNATPPNIFFSTMPSRLARAARTRSASASS